MVAERRPSMERQQNLTPEEEHYAKSREHKFGLCEYCHVGLDCLSDFACYTPTSRGFKMICNACHEHCDPEEARKIRVARETRAQREQQEKQEKQENPELPQKRGMPS